MKEMLVRAQGRPRPRFWGDEEQDPPPLDDVEVTPSQLRSAQERLREAGASDDLLEALLADLGLALVEPDRNVLTVIRTGEDGSGRESYTLDLWGASQATARDIAEAFMDVWSGLGWEEGASWKDRLTRALYSYYRSRRSDRDFHFGHGDIVVWEGSWSLVTGDSYNGDLKVTPVEPEDFETVARLLHEYEEAERLAGEQLAESVQEAFAEVQKNKGEWTRHFDSYEDAQPFRTALRRVATNHGLKIKTTLKGGPQTKPGPQTLHVTKVN